MIRHIRSETSWWSGRDGLEPFSAKYVAVISDNPRNGGRPVRTCIELANWKVPPNQVCPHLKSHSAKGIYITALGGVCDAGHMRRHPWQNRLRGAIAKMSFGLRACCTPCGTGENISTPKAGDAGSTVLVN